MKKAKEESEECFVIMPISNQENYDNGHFSLVYEDIIKPSIQQNNMIPKRADETKNTNLIQLDILKRIIETPIAICDMSSKNPNVFYELGMRQAFDMPTVLIIDDITKAPFDISSLRYVTYEHKMGYRAVKKTIEELSEALKETYLKKDDRTEINSLIRLMELRTPAILNPTDIPENEKLMRLHELELSDIKSSIKNLERTMTRALRFERIKEMSPKLNLGSYLDKTNIVHKKAMNSRENIDDIGDFEIEDI